MANWQDGFLSEPVDHVVDMIRDRYSAWRELLYRVNRLAVATLHALDIHLDSDVERYSSILFARIVSTVQSAVILLERGLVPQSRILLRSALEALFQLGAIACDGTVVDGLIEAHANEQRRAAKYVLRWQNEELRQVAEKELSSEVLQSFINSHASTLSVATLAKKAGFEDWYHTLYMVLSWPTHSAAIDLERHVVRDSDGELLAFCNEPEVDGQENSWACATELLMKSILALAEIFPNLEKNEVESCYADARSLLEKVEG